MKVRYHQDLFERLILRRAGMQDYAQGADRVILASGLGKEHFAEPQR